MSFDPKVIEALAYLRGFIAVDARPGTQQAFNTLDNAGVFAALDEQTDYASAVEILAESAVKAAAEDRFNFEHPAEPPRRQIQDVNRGSDYGLTEEEGRRAGLGSALPPRQGGYAAVSGLGSLERVPGTNTLRPARQTAPCSCGGVGSGCTCD